MVRILNINDGFDPALKVLRDGGLVTVPTETVYGLAADATNSQAVASIYAAKGRPSFNPLIAHIADVTMAEKYAEFSDTARVLADAFWPGPLTLVLPKKEGTPIASTVTAGLDTIALRHPKGIMAELAGALGNPISAPSANTSGRISPTLAEHVADDLGDKVDLILDGGRCDVGVESTILKVVGDQVTLLREGGLDVEQIEAVIGPVIKEFSNKKIEAPGQLLAHYAPNLPIRLNAAHVSDNEALLCLGMVQVSGKPHTQLNLSPSGDLSEAAHNLFAMLQELDKSGALSIAVQEIPANGLGAAINDRLKRAAAGASLK